MSKKNGTRSSTVPSELLDDITSRFLLDAPNNILSDPISLCFLLEQAFWFYLDEYVEDDDSLSAMKFEVFASQLIQHVKLKTDTESIEEMFQNFREFKQRVPTYGGLLLNTDLTNVLLVQGFCHRTSWGFPKGKINVNEEPHVCAIREVLEETGYDITSLIDPNVYLENVIGEQKVRLYIIPGVSMQTEFAPKTKGEIKEHKWFPVNQLPLHKHNKNFTKMAASGSSSMFYMVMPFVKPLRDWISSRLRNSVPPPATPRRRHKSLSSNPENTNRNLSPLVAESRRQNQQGLLPTPDPNPSPKKKEARPKIKGKRNFSENPNEDSHQKFSFKSRGKPKASQSNLAKNPSGNYESPATYVRKTQPLSATFSQPLAWQNFRFNKKAINDALDRVWSRQSL